MSSSRTNEPCPVCGNVYGPALLHAPTCPVRIGFHRQGAHTLLHEFVTWQRDSISPLLLLSRG